MAVPVPLCWADDGYVHGSFYAETCIETGDTTDGPAVCGDIWAVSALVEVHRRAIAEQNKIDPELFPRERRRIFTFINTNTYGRFRHGAHF